MYRKGALAKNGERGSLGEFALELPAPALRGDGVCLWPMELENVGLWDEVERPFVDLSAVLKADVVAVFELPLK